MEFLRPATAADASRIAEIIVTNYRTNFYPFFRNDAFYFGELNVVDMASEYAEDTQQLRNTYVYDDGIVKGIIRISGDAIEKLYVEPQFQGQRIGAHLLDFAVRQKQAEWLWVLEYNTRAIAFYQRHGFQLTGEKIVEDEFVPLLKMVYVPNIRLRCIAQDSPEKAVLERINEEAFPASERTAIEDLYATGGDSDLDMIGIDADGELAGFFAVRKFEKIRYLAYFAICKEKRSRGIGGRALQQLQEFYPNCQIITEFEAPDETSENAEIRLRRRAFYLRNGFCETGWYNFYDGTELVIACSDTASFEIRHVKQLIAHLNTIIAEPIPQPYQK